MAVLSGFVDDSSRAEPVGRVLAALPLNVYETSIEANLGGLSWNV